MNTSVLLNVKYELKNGMRDCFINDIKSKSIDKLSMDEAGNIKYEYTLPKEDQDVVYLEEIWVDEDAQQKHTLTPHFTELGKIKDRYVNNTTINKTDVYLVHTPDAPLNITVEVPGSKSMTNRALLLAALGKEKSVLRGVLFSDDSRHFLDCLKSLGFDVDIDEDSKIVVIQGTGGDIPNKCGEINVGSAGTAARFLTAMLSLSEGSYTINCSKQMKKRPMKPLFEVLKTMGASFEYLEKDGFLPVKVKGCKSTVTRISMDISRSTQFLSAMLMMSVVLPDGLHIDISSEKKDGSYIRITRNMMQQFGIETDFDGVSYEIKSGQNVNVGDYFIEPDLSGACYFYAMAAVTGGCTKVKNIKSSTLQGDIKFVDVLKRIGCTITEDEDGIKVTGNKDGYKGIDIDMNDFSDQALTLAAITPFAKSETIIRNIGHIRGQECDRMNAIVTELGKCGVKCEISGDDIIVHNGAVKSALIDTYEDHRVAMAFSLIGLKQEGIFIKDPYCCKKTFENYFNLLDSILQNHHIS